MSILKQNSFSTLFTSDNNLDNLKDYEGKEMKIYMHGKYRYDSIDGEGGIYPLEAIYTIPDHLLSSSESNINNLKDPD